MKIYRCIVYEMILRFIQSICISLAERALMNIIPPLVLQPLKIPEEIVIDDGNGLLKIYPCALYTML